MANIENIINISMNNGTKSITQAQFGTSLLIVKSCFMPDKVMTFNNVDDIRALYLGLDQKTNTSDIGKKFDEDLFKTINAYFASEPKPQKIMLARRDCNYGCTPVLAANTVYSASFQWYQNNALQTETISFTSSANVPLLTDIYKGLNDAIYKSKLKGIIIAKSISGSDPSFLGLQFVKDPSSSINFFNLTSLSDSLKNQPLFIPLQTSVSAYSDAISVSRDFFGVGVYATVNGNDELSIDDVLQLFDAIEATQRMSIYATSDPNCLIKSSTNDLMYLAKQKGYKYCAVFQKDPLDSSQAMPMSLLANLLSRPAGSASFAYKNLPTVQVTQLTQAQSDVIFSKNGNTYESMGGTNVTRYGISSGGQFLDVTLGFAFLKARLSEAWFSSLVNIPKISFTDSGFAILENSIRAIMAIAAQQGIVASWNVQIPKAADILPNDKANGVLNNLIINCVVQGSVQKVNAVFNFTL